MMLNYLKNTKGERQGSEWSERMMKKKWKERILFYIKHRYYRFNSRWRKISIFYDFRLRKSGIKRKTLAFPAHTHNDDGVTMYKSLVSITSSFSFCSLEYRIFFCVERRIVLTEYYTVLLNTLIYTLIPISFSKVINPLPKLNFYILPMA